MVNLKKILKLGGFADAAKTQYFGFARKSMPPDTPHDENKTRWRVNQLGQKVEDAGTPGSEIREKYIKAIENTVDEAARTDIVRAVGVMAEKGDQEAGKYLLGLLKQDHSPQVRKCILSKLAFAFKTQLVPFSKVILEGIRHSVADNESVLRGMTVDLLNAASKKIDEHDLTASIKPQNRRTCFMSRDSAWDHVKGIAQAINSSTLVLGLVDMMSHAVLPVRMTCWEVLGGKDASATTGRCRELEQRLYRRKVALVKCGEELTQCHQAVDDALNEAMEESREAVATKIRSEQARGIELQADSSFMTKFQKSLVHNDPAYVAAVKAAKEKEAQFVSIEEDIAADNEAYQRVKEELKQEILSKIGYMLQDDSPPIAMTNKLLGKSGNGNWYIRRTVVRMILPLAEAGDATATELLNQTLADRSPYVRRTAVRALKQARLAERERAIARASATRMEDKTVALAPTASSELESPPLSPHPRSPSALTESDRLGSAGEGADSLLTQTPEERRKQQKARLKEQEEMEASARLHSLNIKEYGTREVVELLESMRMHFMEHTDQYKRAAREHSVDGEFMLQASDEELKKVLGMTVRKARTMLRVTMKDKVAEYERETDPRQIAEAAQSQLLSAANDAASRIKALKKEVLDDDGVKNMRIKQALKQDSYMFGGNEGLGCVLFRDAEGHVIFKRVLPCGGIVCEGDMLLKVQQEPVLGKSLVDVMHLLVSYGQMCPCVVRLASQKQRLEDLRKRRAEWEARHQAAAKKRPNLPDHDPPPEDLLRTVNVTCHPPPFKEDYIESIGLDIEVFQGDATRSLQMMTVLNRNGFSAYLEPILLDGVKQLVDLAAKFKDPEWAKSVGVTAGEHRRFMQLLKRLALRFKLKDPRPELKREERREHAHAVWRFMQGVTASQRLSFTSKYRSEDASASLDDFRSTGRVQRQVQREALGQDFTVLWHEQLGITVELLHCSTGTFRISVPRPRQARRLGQSQARNLAEGEGREGGGAEGEHMQTTSSVEGGSRRQYTVLACFSDGRRAEVRGFVAGELADRVKEGELAPAEVMEEEAAREREEDGKRKGGKAEPEAAERSQGLPPISRRGSKSSHAASHKTSDSADGFPAQRQREQLPSIFGDVEGEEAMQGGEGLVRRGSEDSRLSWAGSRPRTVAGEHFGMGGLLKKMMGKKERLRRASVDADSVDDGLDDDEEEVVGYHVEGEEGMRVKLRERVMKEMPDLVEEIGGAETVGTIVWVDPFDADGDGVTGDICKVRWDNGYEGDYRTGFEGGYRLAAVEEEEQDQAFRGREVDAKAMSTGGKETVIGLHIAPSEGQRVVLLQSALTEMPELLADSGGGPGTITWVDPDDADGDGVIGDICEVEWDVTGVVGDYRTGYEGIFRLGLYKPPEEAPKTKRGSTAGVAEEARGPARGRSGLARVRRGDEVEEHPWQFLDEWEAAQAAAKQEEERRAAAPQRPQLDLIPRKMEPEGKASRVEAGTWVATVQSHGDGYGSTIEIRIKEEEAAASPAHPRKAGKQTTEQQAGGMVVQLTGDAVVVMMGGQPQGQGLAPPQRAAEAFRVMGDGLTEMSALEASLLVEGVPLSKLQQAVADCNEAQGNRPAATEPHATGNDSMSRAGSHASHVDPTPPRMASTFSAHSAHSGSSRPGSRGSGPGSGKVSRAGSPASLPRPASSRSGQKGAKYGRPVTPISGRPYTPSRPNSRGSVRHRLNIENSFGFETDMLMEPKAKMVDKMWGGEQGSEERARDRQYHQTEANLLIDDD